jgi:GNAT superfamily N-acetyltransferase
MHRCICGFVSWPRKAKLARAMARRLVEVSPDDPRSRALLDSYYAEIGSRFAADVAGVRSHSRAGDMEAGRGTFVLVLEDDEGGRAVACGGMRMLDAATGEIKRMYVVPEARKRGHARALLAALEDAARTRGATRAVLDTDARDAEAIALYLSSGYAAVPPYNDNPQATAWFAKSLRSED